MVKDFSEDRFDIFIQAGQSNAEGYGFGPVEAPYEVKPTVWYFNPDSTFCLAAEKVTGNEIQSNFSLPFADEYVKAGLLAPDRKLLILRCAVGGVGFLDHRWRVGDDLYNHMVYMGKTVLELNPENRLMGLLWHQGEADAAMGASYETHYRHLMDMLRTAAGEWKAPEMPFVAGDLVHHWKGDNAAACAPVVAAMQAVCRDWGHGAFVETEGLLSNKQELNRDPLGWEDPIHFSRKAVYELGKRYFAAWRGIK